MQKETFDAIPIDSTIPLEDQLDIDTSRRVIGKHLYIKQASFIRERKIPQACHISGKRRFENTDTTCTWLDEPSSQQEKNGEIFFWASGMRADIFNPYRISEDEKIENESKPYRRNESVRQKLPCLQRFQKDWEPQPSFSRMRIHYPYLNQKEFFNDHLRRWNKKKNKLKEGGNLPFAYFCHLLSQERALQLGKKLQKILQEHPLRIIDMNKTTFGWMVNGLVGFYTATRHHLSVKLPLEAVENIRPNQAVILSFRIDLNGIPDNTIKSYLLKIHPEDLRIFCRGKGHILREFTPEEIRKLNLVQITHIFPYLTAKQRSYLTAEQVEATNLSNWSFPDEVVREYTAAEVQALTPKQLTEIIFNALSTEQRSYLTKEQIKKINISKLYESDRSWLLQHYWKDIDGSQLNLCDKVVKWYYKLTTKKSNQQVF